MSDRWEFALYDLDADEPYHLDYQPDDPVVLAVSVQAAVKIGRAARIEITKERQS